jgi:NDP-4-keto-2,6-dideoxyhexose 3-C-methyltransferase
MIVNTATTCRVCNSDIIEIADLGNIHINDFPSDPNYSKGLAPLVLDQCVNCKLVQLRHTVDPNILYGEHYWYQSGLNPKLKQNLIDIAKLVNDMSIPGDIILDIGANDGTLLSGVANDRYKIACEPAPNLQAKLANHADYIIPTMWDSIHMDNKLANVITAIGMFYDMDDPNDFIRSVKNSLEANGLFIAQLMTLAPMLKMKDLGNICHEHLEYYSYTSLVELYERNGLEIFHVEENDIQGGSYQIWARHYTTGSIVYNEDISSLHEFFELIKRTGEKLRLLLDKYIAEGKKCYVYGASTKGNTLLQIWKLGKYFKGAAEIHTEKWGRYTVGTQIPIVDEEQTKADADVFFVPNYGFKDLFINKEKNWINNGGVMIFAMPEVEVVKKMKILIAAGPRTGSHAFCQTQPVENNLYEIMNIEDCILPRLDDESIDFSICSKEFLLAADDRRWETAWDLKPVLSDKHHVLLLDDNLKKVNSPVYPDREEFLHAQYIRWEKIKKLDDWCIKIIQYHGIPDQLLNEIINHADKFYVLQRRDKVAQSLSLTKATQTQHWHGTTETPIVADAGSIDYQIFSKSCRAIRADDQWLDTRFNECNTEQVYYEDLDLDKSEFVKNHISLSYDKTLCERYWEWSSETIDTWFKKSIIDHDWEPIRKIDPIRKYFNLLTDQSINELSYWNTHITALKSIGIDYMSRDIAWLDVGVWFGVMPFILKQNGFTNIETTDCEIHRGSIDEYLRKLWSNLDITPRELEIRAHTRFDLGKQYDLITIMQSNFFWKTEDVIHYAKTDLDESLDISWQCQGIDGKVHTYFKVYNKEEWEFFVENIREFLTPGGVAIINPEPWVYDNIASCAPARDYLKQFQIDNIPIKNPYGIYRNYLVIRK